MDLAPLQALQWMYSVSRAFDRALLERDFGLLADLLSACPMLWATVEYEPEGLDRLTGQAKKMSRKTSSLASLPQVVL